MTARPGPPGPLPLSFYARPAQHVAPDLVGKTLARRMPDGTVRRARITETEAYIGAHDKASHARFGRTRRNAAMWGPPGRAYVYLVYGLHHCLNVVTASEGDPQAVLVRAGRPLDGWQARLGGPALLASAFGITRRDDGADLRGRDLWLETGTGAAPTGIGRTARIGVGYAGAWAGRRLRFVEALAVTEKPTPGFRLAGRRGPRRPPLPQGAEGDARPLGRRRRAAGR